MLCFITVQFALQEERTRKEVSAIPHKGERGDRQAPKAVISLQKRSAPREGMDSGKARAKDTIHSKAQGRNGKQSNKHRSREPV